MKAKIQAALLDLLLAQMRQTVLTNVAVSILVGMVIVSTFGVVKVLIWVLVGVVIGGWRIYFINHLYQHGLTAFEPRSILKKLALMLFFNGLHWGAAAWFFLDPSQPDIYVFVAVAILGMVSASLSSLSAVPKLWLVFACSLFTFVIARMLTIGNWSAALMSIMFVYGLWVLSKTLGNRIRESITKDFENAALLKEVKAAKEHAEKLNIEKSRFMAATSHDLRQPLHAQGLLLEALKGKVSNAQQTKLVEKLFKSNQALNELFESLLEVSRLDSGTVKVSLSHQSLLSLCSDLVEEFEALAQKKGLKLSLQGDDCTVISDRVLLTRVVRNLLSNAIKHTDEGSVTVKVNQFETFATVAVIDTGCGIPEAEHEAIFDEYVQLDNYARDRSKGVGLGLALVRRMCELLEHDIKLDSSEGQGASFTVTLPLGDANKVSKATPRSETSSIKGLTVLVLDDDLPILEAFKALEEEWQCKFELFSSFSKVKIHAQQAEQKPDVIVCDYRLTKQLNGMDAIRNLRSIYNQQIPAVIISGDTDAALIKAVKDQGFYLLHKPINANQLKMAIAILANSPETSNNIYSAEHYR